MKNMKTCLICIAIISLFTSTLVALDHFGKRGRVTGDSFLLGAGRILCVEVQQEGDVFKIWKERRCKGRVVVSLSRRLNFVSAADTELIDESGIYAAPNPLVVFNLAPVFEKKITAKNFMFTSMKADIARKVIHVLPDADFQSINRGTSGKKVVLTDLLGSPRLITTLDAIRCDMEPVLLYISASFFKETDPLTVWRHLLRKGVRTDCIVLCYALNDDEVTENEREKLVAFAGLLSGEHVLP